MVNSIQQFLAKGVEKLEKVFDEYSGDLTKVAEMVTGVSASVVELGLSMIAEEWEFASISGDFVSKETVMDKIHLLDFPEIPVPEEIIYSADEIMKMEREHRKKLGDLADLPVYTIPYQQVKKKAALKNHIWGL